MTIDDLHSHQGSSGTTLGEHTTAIAAVWWADWLRTDYGSDPDRHPRYRMLNADARYANCVSPAPQESQTAEFERVLAGSIRRELSDLLQEPSDDDGVVLSCDYEADELLALCLIAAGITEPMRLGAWPDSSRLPTKTTMIVTRSTVTVACGYGASFEQIYPPSITDDLVNGTSDMRP